MNISTKSVERIIAIPGLGGRANVFRKYQKFFSEYDFRYVDLINWQETERIVAEMLADGRQTAILSSCYGGQPAIRLSEKFSNISGIIIIEPFFAQFFWWRKIALTIVNIFLKILNAAGKIGWKRNNFPEIDYEKVETWPVIIQPIFDMRHQKLSDYYGKVKDILEFRLPEHFSLPTLFIFSPKGFTRSKSRREDLRHVFTKAHIVELGEKSHNIVTLSSTEISLASLSWLASLHI